LYWSSHTTSKEMNMPTYLARVELYNAEPEDYEGLHKYMLSLGFRRTIPHGDGSYNQLPDGTYVSEKGGDIYQIRSQISDYADRLSRYRASVFVCEFSQCAWYLYPAKTR
ncbi:hypothetical protein ACULYN_005307, partial [Escherichia coli]